MYDPINYAIQSDGDLWIRFDCIDRSYEGMLEEGDEIKFELNLDESSIYMSKSGREKEALFTSIETGDDLQYKFAVAFYRPTIEDAVTITDVEDLTFKN